MRKVNVAVVGASGLVGRKIREILEERNFPVEKLFAFASKKSAGTKIEYAGREVIIEELKEDSFDGRGIDIALFAAGGSVSEKYIPLAIKNNIKVVDNSSFFRMDKNVPLVIPEVNSDDIKEDDMLIANPNCSTIQSVLAISKIHKDFGIERIIYNTYQAVSGGGERALEDLYEKKNDHWKYKIYDNVLPQIDVFLDNGYTKEEMKMIDETRKILDDQDLKITATAIRVPVSNSHGVSINLKLKKDFTLDEIRQTIKATPGVILEDDIKEEIYPMPAFVSGKDEVFVGRIREDYSCERSLNLWTVADNIRKGAALNAIEISELLVEDM
ncbi:aspartate-semialdehyde dehydrogenase [Anaerococcus sp. NML200574]|uniref:aspartate-semialdehyde dehydrogenase n=1 Tax=Anaerococcus sp. NML200574 TaxID=2954486 RepID=UPI0022389DE6|nr:aspartate-semialdehyde dehydrogenase [Anaerococcus sp. NML200574]MCW6678924.1 aspartate-semialdehyde dehydrogenase [Anaerococcus sp. NML200574]